jgi:H+/Cl- antiporter ClcA
MGLPISAIIFAMEYRKKRDFLTLGYSALAAALGYVISHAMQTPHWAPTANSINSLPIDFQNLNWVGFGLFIFAIFIFLNFFESTHFKIEKKLDHKKKWLTLLISGLFISFATLSLGTVKFNNLGTNIIDLSFAGEIQISDWFSKIFFTEVSLLGFWKGGAFTPLMSIGAATGSLLATFFMLSSAQTSAALGSAVSCFSLVNLRFKLPITSIILTCELFGWRMGLLSAPLHLGLGLRLKHSKK